MSEQIKFKLSQKSKDKLKGVHEDLVKIVNRAIEITEIDFAVGEGLRTLERQKQLLKERKTQTLKSRHITGHALDLWAWVDGEISWEYKHYPIIAKAMKQASKELNIPIEWGGDWKSFKDGVHFQLPSALYK